jgi:hypothetical protein
MAAFFGERLVLPIGCSCVAQFQLQLSPRLRSARLDAQLFDWAITTPDATASLLAQPGPVVEALDELELVHGRVRARRQRGLYFWHIKKTLGLPEATPLTRLDAHRKGMQQFISQHRHLAAKLGAPVEELHCLWSNVQPNLRHAVEAVGEPWSAFELTAARYDAIRAACAQWPARRLHNWFVCRPEDVEPSLHAAPGVVLLDLPRDPLEYQGAPGLFDPVFERMGIVDPPSAGSCAA